MQARAPAAVRPASVTEAQSSLLYRVLLQQRNFRPQCVASATVDTRDEDAAVLDMAAATILSKPSMPHALPLMLPVATIIGAQVRSSAGQVLVALPRGRSVLQHD